MHCRRCGNPLEKPGDYCLTCNTANCDAVVAVFAADRATLTFLDNKNALGEATVATIPEPDDETRVVQFQNFAGLVADEIRHKRPETMYAAGKRTPLHETRMQLRHEFYRIPSGDSVQRVLDTRGERTLEVVSIPPAKKLGGSHGTLIGGRRGRRITDVATGYPHIEKAIPGPTDAGGTGSRAGLRVKVTRADGNGNVRLLLRDGSSVQESCIVMTAMNRETGERVRDNLSEALRESGFRDGQAGEYAEAGIEQTT